MAAIKPHLIEAPVTLSAYEMKVAKRIAENKAEQERIFGSLVKCPAEGHSSRAVTTALKDLYKNKNWTLGTQTIGGVEVRLFVAADNKPVLPDNMVKPLLTAMHASGGCASKTSLLGALTDHFNIGKYMSKVIDDAARAVQLSCAVCFCKIPLPKKQHKESIYTYEFGERFQIDASEVAPTKLKFLRKNGYRYVLTCVDCTTKVGWVWALKTLKMDETFEILQEHFDTVMVPDILHSDNGPRFRNKLITRFAEVERFAHICGASDTPQHQGQVESFNKTI